MPIVLGIDIGTTAVKACLVSGEAHVMSNSTVEYSMQCLSSPFPKGSETDVSSVLVAVLSAVRALDLPRFPPTAVALCGQMHGIVWWSAKDLVDGVNQVLSSTSKTVPTAWSSLISWQDGRCDGAFLDACRSRVPDHLSPLSSGYGIATFAHVMQHSPCQVERFDTCGTIMDLVAFALCGHTRPTDATMDTTNAFSWGAFDSQAHAWPASAVSALGIPVDILPRVVRPGSIVGMMASRTTSVFANVIAASSIPVYAPMGDHPCSVLALLHVHHVVSPVEVAMINIGTSAQLSYVETPSSRPDDDENRRDGNSYSFEKRPYFGSQDLYVAAALTGGNVFARFVANCVQWATDLGVPSTASDGRMFANVIAMGLQRTDTALTCRPTFGGERSQSANNTTGQLSNMAMDNWSIGDMSAAIARGIVTNLIELLPKRKQIELRRRRVLGSGNALLRNALLQHFVQAEFAPNAVVLCRESDAAVGAALVVLQYGAPSI
ncbi:hypothetical protein, variant 3 [Aphanomyces invadans]|uniref:Carbohydrate kinase FGGY N-terminal domain-containing protein n=1 Tax=Aphanomyces invadans TaxID=157072 RepID=A0A024TGA7_9STRA|nr:hypothetical protein, variant 3 [Aphanomyces invadans]ETV93029.1 hypothetical protein, variant 3 [Aphanomyces invadans]|eukprot:XP_008878299.1 hypothetical protein, variant 3 [Aphanomyces invadans]